MYTEHSHPRRFLTLSNVGAGTVELEYEDGSETLGRAESCILPAAIGEVRVVSRTGRPPWWRATSLTSNATS